MQTFVDRHGAQQHVGGHDRNGNAVDRRRPSGRIFVEERGVTALARIALEHDVLGHVARDRAGRERQCGVLHRRRLAFSREHDQTGILSARRRDERLERHAGRHPSPTRCDERTRAHAFGADERPGDVAVGAGRLGGGCELDGEHGQKRSQGHVRRLRPEPRLLAMTPSFEPGYGRIPEPGRAIEQQRLVSVHGLIVGRDRRVHRRRPEDARRRRSRRRRGAQELRRTCYRARRRHGSDRPAFPRGVQYMDGDGERARGTPAGADEQPRGDGCGSDADHARTQAQRHRSFDIQLRYHDRARAPEPGGERGPQDGDERERQNEGPEGHAEDPWNRAHGSRRFRKTGAGERADEANGADDVLLRVTDDSLGGKDGAQDRIERRVLPHREQHQKDHADPQSAQMLPPVQRGDHRQRKDRRAHEQAHRPGGFEQVPPRCGEQFGEVEACVGRRAEKAGPDELHETPGMERPEIRVP